MSISLRSGFAALFALSVAIIAYVQFAQHVQHFLPCELCLRERLPWYGMIAVSALGLLRPARALMLLAALLLLASAGLGLHHVGVEQKWWPGPEACTGGVSGASNIDELRAMLKATPVVRCDEIVWRLFGLSMTTYNFLVSLAASAAAFGVALRPAKLSGVANAQSPSPA